MGRLAGRGMPSRLGRAPSRLRFGTADAAVRGGQAWRRWYATARWRKLSAEVIADAGMRCEQTGVPLIGRAPAPDSPVVDHKVPHRGDPDLFWDRGNLQAVSKAWHDSVKQRQERRGDV